MFGLELLEKYVEDKVCEYGARVVMQGIAALPGGQFIEAAARISEFIESDGVSELKRLASGELHKLEQPLTFKFKGMDLINKMQDAFQHPAIDQQHKSAWQHTDWAKSRQDWLSNAWEHDWRSQPRNPAGGHGHWSGEWIPGRLPSPVTGAHAIGKGKSRTSRRRRRINRYRRYGRMAARSVKLDES